MEKTFFERLKDLCAEKGVSPNGVAKAIGKSSGSVTSWKNGTTPRMETIGQIADYLGVPVTRLLSDEQKESPPISDREAEDREFMELYQDAPEDIRTAVLTILKNGAGR